MSIESTSKESYIDRTERKKNKHDKKKKKKKSMKEKMKSLINCSLYEDHNLMISVRRRPPIQPKDKRNEIGKCDEERHEDTNDQGGRTRIR